VPPSRHLGTCSSTPFALITYTHQPSRVRGRSGVRVPTAPAVIAVWNTAHGVSRTWR
jgi:hypothetical protein